MPNMIIVSPDPVGFKLDLDVFQEASRAKFGQHATLVRTKNADSPVDVTTQVDRPGEPSFQIFHYRGGDMISTDGTGDRVLEVALWVRSLLPDDLGMRIWLVDQGYHGHVELVPGMTEEDVKSGWIDHAEFPPE